MSEDHPLEPPSEHDRDVGGVIDLADVRIRWGRSSYKARPCEHKRLIYSQSERRVWCEDCTRTIDSFDAFMVMTKHIASMLSEARGKLLQAETALRGAARLRATKTLERLWGKRNPMAVQCPHCRGGLLPEDFADGARSAWSRELEIAERSRRERDKRKGEK